MSSIKAVQDWGLPHPGMFLCAGPCSAESHEQLRAAAGALAGTISVFRAGIWKPRTRPGTFASAGAEALKWLAAVRAEFGVRIAAEVGTPRHVELAVRHGLDMVWIGARTTPDPFAVQAIADALKGLDVAVLVKNPVSPDLELWLGALERMQNAGISRLGAVHRGFTTSHDTRYRNSPLWRIPIELRRRLPGVPMICDPSHMCGRADLIFPTAQEALDLLYDGLMVEVHHSPKDAWSDAGQQLSPAQFRDLLCRLVIRRETGPDQSYESSLRTMRHGVDEIDDAILDLLARRMRLAGEMGQLKRQHQVSTLQPARWNEILASRQQAGRNRGLSEDFIARVYEIIHEEAIRLQEEPLFRDSGDSRPST